MVVVVVAGCEDVPDELEGVELDEDGAHGLGRGFVFGAPWGVDGPGGVAPGGGAAMNMISGRTTICRAPPAAAAGGCPHTLGQLHSTHLERSSQTKLQKGSVVAAAVAKGMAERGGKREEGRGEGREEGREEGEIEGK